MIFSAWFSAMTVAVVNPMGMISHATCCSFSTLFSLIPLIAHSSFLLMCARHSTVCTPPSISFLISPALTPLVVRVWMGMGPIAKSSISCCKFSWSCPCAATLGRSATAAILRGVLSSVSVSLWVFRVSPLASRRQPGR